MGQVASALGCGETRNEDAESAQAPIPLRECNTPNSLRRQSNLADLEVKLGDGLAVPEEVRLLPGDYFSRGSYNKRTCYRKEKEDMFIYWACDSWWFSTEIDGLVAIAMVDCLDEKVPSNGWQTPKAMFSPPKDIPLSVQVPSSNQSLATVLVDEVVDECEKLIEEMKSVQIKEELKKKLSEEMVCCRAGCSAFMRDLIDHSPPAVKSCLQTWQEKHYPSMRAKAGWLKDLRAKDVQDAIKDRSTAVKEAVAEGGKIARSTSQDLREKSKAHASDEYERSKATAAKTSELARRKSREFHSMVQDAHTQYYPIVKEQATTMYGNALDAKERVKRKSGQLSEVVSAKSKDAKVIVNHVRSNSLELKEKGCCAALDKLAIAAVALCEAILPHEEDQVSGAIMSNRDETPAVSPTQPEVAYDLPSGQYSLLITKSAPAAKLQTMVITRVSNDGSEQVVAANGVVQ